MMKVTLCVQVLLCCCISSLWGLDFAVRSWQSYDTPSCINGTGLTPCKTLRYLTQQLNESGIRDNISIVILSKFLPTDGKYLFENVSNLKLDGRHRHNRIKCSLSSQGGIIFSNVTNLYISNLYIRQCGIKMDNHSVVVRIRNCRNVIIENSTFHRCRETAVLFMDTYGNVSIVNVNFEHNRLFIDNAQNESHSGGMEIVFTGSKKGLMSKYKIINCLFANNSAPQSFSSFDTTLRQTSEWRGQSVGGALGVYFQGNSSNHAVFIANCTFMDNYALWGAGMHIIIQGEAIDNVLEVAYSNYSMNHAEMAGGGVCVRYFRSDSRPESQDHYNKIMFRHVEFSMNRGDFGGGTTVLSTYSILPSTSRISFYNCTWSSNYAYYGSAVDVAPALFQQLEHGHLPIPEFVQCTFISNSVIDSREENTPPPNFVYQFSGIFIITKSKVYFAGETKFISNSASALYINSGTAIFTQGSDVLFADNRALKGGAIAAYGYSSLVLNRNSLFSFLKNQASELGAGIYYQSFDQHDFKLGRECFLKLGESILPNSDNDTNITVMFEGNTANIKGHSIYASTLYPCFYSNNHELAAMGVTSEVLNFIGDIQFDNNKTALATSGRHFDTNNLQPLYELIPGKLFNIPLRLADDFNQSSENVASLLVTFENNSIKADRDYMIRGNLRLFGRPYTNDTLRITQIAPRKIILSVGVTMLNCPPGFYMDIEEQSCKCSSYTQNLSYYGVLRCDTDEFFSYLLRGFWIGYIPNTVQQPQNLYTAVCPLNFCKLNSDAKYINELPNASSQLSESVCAVNREGILCSDCVKGHSPYFHSEVFKCGTSKLCSVGIVFYILSELVPIVILFTVVIAFDFSFTSGNINGFIFFSQILESLSVDLRTHNRHSGSLMIVTRLFYDIFNFDYFSTSKLSFCLWKGATVIDILAFKYVTVVFALALVVCLILIMNHIKCSKVEESLNIKERLSVTKGLSAFLVICYVQCARTSFYILTPVRLRTQGGIPGELVTLFGGMPFFKGRHLFYAIIAMLFIITIVVIPPLVLTLYPLLLQILALCKLSEHWVVGKVLKVFQIHRLKPLIDTFQGCYKDKLRFFAGLYFLYRVAILAGYSITRSTSQFYVVSQFMIIVFTGIHSIVQPYKKKSHNVIDSFIFLNLLLINGCTIFIDVYTVESRENHFSGAKYIVSLFVVVQVILLYLPMLCFLLWMGRRLVMFASQCCKGTVNKHVFKRQRLDNNLHSSNSVDEGIFDTLDYHELRPTPPNITHVLTSTPQSSASEKSPIQVKINMVASKKK